MCQINAQESNHSLPDNFFSSNHESILYSGRIDFTNSLAPKLISAGAYIKIKFKGSYCTLLFANQYEEPNNNFISIELDGEYEGRLLISESINEYLVAKDLIDTIHTLIVCKATESFTGYVEFQGLICKELLPPGDLPQRKIEFIGNSITCGAEMDTTDFSCGSDQYHDRHNAYLSYGPRLARSLYADWVLSAVSGMGLTRNWNDEGPGLPAFYDNLYLNNDSSFQWNKKDYNPQLVNICLGTNDNSEGDDSYDRKELDSGQFVDAYIVFIKRIRNKYPKAHICLINSPVFDGDTRNKFSGYLSKVVNTLKKENGGKNISYFSYTKQYNNGCTGHPSVEDHKEMARELFPFVKKMMNW
jgi:hypothetical protein